MNSAWQIISDALRDVDGETAKLHLQSGQTVEGTIDNTADGEATVTETGGTVWRVPIAYVTAVGAVA